MNRTNIFALLLCVFVLGACDSAPKDPNRETLTKGNCDLWMDAESAPLIEPLLKKYQSTHPEAIVRLHTADARNCLAELLAKHARIIVMSRGYRPDEDSILKAYKVSPHRNLSCAVDALVFFTRKDFATDTLSVEALKELMTNGTSMQKRIVDLHFDPSFALPSNQSSTVTNLEHYCAQDRDINKTVPRRYFSSIDSVKAYVRTSEKVIGVGYLSQLIRDTSEFKLLGIKYTDADSNRRSMHVDQSAVYREMYPYPVKIVSYLLEDLQNLPMGIAAYLAYEPEPQKSFLTNGIVPTYAKIQLIEEP